MVSAEEFLGLGREVLGQQSFSVLLGAELTAFSPGKVEMALRIAEQHKQQNGFAHGGVISYLADNALTFAGGSALQAPVLTSEFKINYVRPGSGERLIARATADAVSKSQAVCRCEIFVVKDGVEKLCALAQGTIVKLS